MTLVQTLRTVPAGFRILVAVILLACVASATTVEIQLRMANSKIPTESDDHDRAWATYQMIRNINGITIALTGLTAAGLLLAPLFLRASKLESPENAARS